MIGEKLRKAREAKKLSIQDMEKETSIRALYIEAIENGDYQILPGEAYLKGFIKSYANTLGLDGQAMVEEYKAEQGLSVQEEAAADENEPEAASAPVKAKPAKAAALSKQRNYGVVGSNKNNGSMLKKVVIGIFLLLVVCAGVYSMLSPEEEQPVSRPAVKTTAETKPQAAVPADNGQTKPQAPAQTPANQPVSSEVDIDLKLTGRCWMQIEVDNRVVYEGTAQSGEKFNWKGKNSVKITAGNAGVVELSQNGKDLGKLGAEGEVITREFSLNAQNANDKKK